MQRLLVGLAGAFGIAALWRYLTRRPEEARPTVDPAEELRRRLAEARETEVDRDEYDRAEGMPVDQAGTGPVEQAQAGPVEEPAGAAAEPPPKPEPAHAEPEPSHAEAAGEPRSLEERRRAVHAQAQEALSRMERGPED